MKSDKLVLFTFIALSLLGIMAFTVMPKEEDPRIRRRFATTTVLYPGANPDTLLRSVVDPIQDELKKVNEIKSVETENRLNVSVLQIELRDQVTDLDYAWQEVERALEMGSRLLPEGVKRPVLDFGVIDVEAVVLAVTGSEDMLKLIDAAQAVKEKIEQRSDVSQVKIFGSPGIEIRVDIDTEKLHQKGISIGDLLTSLRKNNLAEPSGFLIQEEEKIVIHQDNELKDLAQFASLELDSPNLKTTELGQIAQIRRTTQSPPETSFYWNGKKAVGIGIVPAPQLNVVSFGRSILQQLDSLEGESQGLTLEVVAFQPKRTETRIQDLLFSLGTGIFLIALFLTLIAGWAMAAVVVIAVPVISLGGLFVFYLMGGTLHQISIAAFVISIGQFIDNIVVIVDAVQKSRDGGKSAEQAVQAVQKTLRWPLAFATATAICAFLPMLSAQGGTADFIFALPQVAVITLIISYFVALFFAPTLAKRWVIPHQKGLLPFSTEKLESLFAALALGPKRYAGLVVMGIVALGMVSLAWIDKEFFPESDRNEFLFSVESSPSSSIEKTDRILREVQDWLRQFDKVEQVAAFSGGGIPRFYYNLPNPIQSPHIGQLLIVTRPNANIKDLGLQLENVFSQRHKDVRFTAHFLQQGPPINAKIEVNFFSENLNRRTEVMEKISDYLAADSRLRSVRADDLRGLSLLKLEADDRQLAEIGLSRAELNSILAFYSTGAAVGLYRFDHDPLPINVRSRDGLRLSDQELLKSFAIRGRERDFLVQDLVKPKKQDIVPLIRTENDQVFSRVLADVQPGQTFASVQSDLQKFLSQINLEKGESFQLGGDAKGAGEANASILKIVPLSMLLLVFFLLLEFRSFRKILISLIALPVTVIGVFPGLLLGNSPFGFMSLLGVLALVGIAINNIILLLEAMDETGSLRMAIASRFRAIFLTTALTVLGLLPLALEKSTLWPPLAWTMISGLIAGTFTTLILVPVLYRIFFQSDSILPSLNSKGLTVIPLLVLMTLFPLDLFAQASSFSVEEVIGLSRNSSNAKVFEYQRIEARESGDGNLKSTYFPRVEVGGEFFQRDNPLQVQTPFGPLTQEERERAEFQIEIRQPIFNKSSMFGGRRAARAKVESLELSAKFGLSETAYTFGSRAIQLLMFQREMEAIDENIKNLKARRQDIVTFIQRGRLSSTDLVTLDLALQKLNHQKQHLTIERNALSRYLSLALGLPANFTVRALNSPDAIDLPEYKSDALDVQSLRIEKGRLLESSKQIGDSNWPQIDVFARGLHAEGLGLDQKTWSEVGVGLKWELATSGARSAQQREVQAQAMALAVRAESLARDRSTQVLQMRDRVSETLRHRGELKKLLLAARQRQSIEAQRYYEGRSRIEDVVAAESLYLEISKEIDLNDLTALDQCMQIRHLSDLEIKPSCD